MPPADDRPSKVVSGDREILKLIGNIIGVNSSVLKYGLGPGDSSDKNKNPGSERKIKNREEMER